MTKEIGNIKAFTVAEVAEALGAGYRTILRAIETGKLEAGKVGRNYIVTEAALQRYLEGKGSNE